MPPETPATPWLDPATLARRIGVTVRTLRLWRTKGTGPQPSYIGRRVAYHLADVLLWEQRTRETSTPS